MDLLQPFVRQVIADHRLHNRRVVLATTTPRDLIAPFAREVGFDDVIATTYEVDSTGRYTGELVGPYVWSKGKKDAVAQWCRDNGVDAAQSYAYSDSVFDEPLLSMVGFPNCVNPDWRLRLMAVARRWPVMHFDVPVGVAKIPVIGLEAQQALMKFARPEVFPYARFSISGTENIPRDSAAILCGNHRSYFDIAAISLAVAKTGRAVRFLGKKEVFDAPVIGPLATALGGIRVERGTGSDEPLRAASQSLLAGDLVAIMPQGTIPRGPAFFDPVLKGRWGAARLADETRAPVIPVGIWGTENVWPRNAKLPNITNVTTPPQVIVRVGEPVTLSYLDPDEDTRLIMEAISALLPDEARVHREPTAEELRRSYPSNYSGDPEAEEIRRPGTD
jgi:putative phosphoserine phosphatase/1-acylglycerol-3-phosphate O-acyltransferase